jgi:aminoglycoside/choline kinase family phosphotransferase
MLDHGERRHGKPSASRIEEAVCAYAARVFALTASAVRAEKLAGDASMRQYFRIHLPDGRHYIVARYPEPFDPATHPYCDVTALFLKAGLPVPMILDADGARAMMLLEDLGDLRLQEWLRWATPDEQRAAYQEAIGLILRIQDATDLAHECGSVASRLAFDVEKLEGELRFFFVNFFEKYLGLSLDPERAERLHAEFQQIATELAAIPRVLTHRDFHSRNLMWHRDRLYIIDHQDARLGPPSYDVASLLGDPYVELEEGLIEEMLDLFLREKARGKAGWSSERCRMFRQELELMSLQRLLKATGTYAYQTAVLGNSVYVPYIPRALQRAARVLFRLGRFPALQDVFEEIIAPALTEREGIHRDVPTGGV